MVMVAKLCETAYTVPFSSKTLRTGISAGSSDELISRFISINSIKPSLNIYSPPLIIATVLSGFLSAKPAGKYSLMLTAVSSAVSQPI